MFLLRGALGIWWTKDVGVPSKASREHGVEIVVRPGRFSGAVVIDTAVLADDADVSAAAACVQVAAPSVDDVARLRLGYRHLFPAASFELIGEVSDTGGRSVTESGFLQNFGNCRCATKVSTLYNIAEFALRPQLLTDKTV